MALSEKATAAEFDRVRHEEFVSASDRAARDMILGCPNPGYPFDQLGTNLHALSMYGRMALLAKKLGATKERVLAPILCALEFVEGLYPAEPRPNWRAASIDEEPVEAEFDHWQVRTGPDASDFELRRGVELAIAQVHATEQFIASAQAELGRRHAERHQARRQLRSSVGR